MYQANKLTRKEAPIKVTIEIVVAKTIKRDQVETG
jgi:hypothetical protein